MCNSDVTKTYGESPVKTFDKAIGDMNFRVLVSGGDELYEQAEAEDRAITFWFCVALVVIFFAIYGVINFIDHVAG